MKIFEWIKIKSGIKKNDDDLREYYFSLNRVFDDKYTIYSYKLHSSNYNDLRNFKKQQYETGYLFRNKKGFNTIGFNIKYDIIIASINGEILDNIQEVERGYTSKYYNKGFYILYLPIGSINYFNIKNRDVVSFKNKKNLY